MRVRKFSAGEFIVWQIARQLYAVEQYGETVAQFKYQADAIHFARRQSRLIAA